jgi:hypothetical protein
VVNDAPVLSAVNWSQGVVLSALTYRSANDPVGAGTFLKVAGRLTLAARLVRISA